MTPFDIFKYKLTGTGYNFSKVTISSKENMNYNSKIPREQNIMFAITGNLLSTSKV
jgi:hypothetical protein